MRRTRGPDSVLPPSLPPIGINRAQAAEFVGVSPSFFDGMVASGAMPEPRRAGGRVIWDVAELERAFRALPQDHKLAQGDDEEGDPYAKAFGG